MRLRVGMPRGSTASVHAWVFITGPAIPAAIGTQCLSLLHFSGGRASTLADSSLRRAMINRLFSPVAPKGRRPTKQIPDTLAGAGTAAPLAGYIAKPHKIKRFPYGNFSLVPRASQEAIQR